MCACGWVGGWVNSWVSVRCVCARLCKCDSCWCMCEGLFSYTWGGGEPWIWVFVEWGRMYSRAVSLPGGASSRSIVQALMCGWTFSMDVLKVFTLLTRAA